MTKARLCIYHLFVWSNLDFLHNSQWITFPTKLCLILYSLCTNLLHSLIMWLIVSSLSPHNIRLLFCCVVSIFVLTLLVLMALFCAEEIHFLSWGFPILAISRFSRVQFHCLSLEVCIQLFFIPFSGYLCSVDACFVCIVPCHSNQSWILCIWEKKFFLKYSS